MARKNHTFGITLRSEKTKAETFEDLQKALDVPVLNDAGAYIMAWDWTPKKSGKSNGSGNEKLGGFLSALGGIPERFSFLKGRPWWHIYIGIALVILTGQFIWNLAH